MTILQYGTFTAALASLTFSASIHGAFSSSAGVSAKPAGRKLNGDHEDKDFIIDLGNLRPEGTHALTADDGADLGLDSSLSYVLVSELYYGGVKLVDVVNKTVVRNIVPSAETFQERGGLGLFYSGGHILVASAGPLLGNPFEVYLYDAATGELVTTCVAPDGVEAGLFNDIEVVGEYAYVTDSTLPRLWNFSIPEAIEGSCNLMYADLDADLFTGTDDNPAISNGIVAFGDGFLISLFHTGGLYYVEPSNGVTEELVPLGELSRPDGLELVTEEDSSYTLYITEGPNRLSVYKIEAGERGILTATWQGVLKSDLFDTPATSAVIGDTIYTANLRADTLELNATNEDAPDMFTETFGLVGLSRFVAEDKDESPTAAPTSGNDKSAVLAPSLMCAPSFVFMVCSMLAHFMA